MLEGSGLRFFPFGLSAVEALASFGLPFDYAQGERLWFGRIKAFSFGQSEVMGFSFSSPAGGGLGWGLGASVATQTPKAPIPAFPQRGKEQGEALTLTPTLSLMERG